MAVRVTCSWCHALALAELRHCPSCGHRLGGSRADCFCTRCANLYYRAVADRFGATADEAIVVEGDPPKLWGPTAPAFDAILQAPEGGAE